MTTPQTPRPDQRNIPGQGTAPGSRSGSGEFAGALSYPGVPAAVPNCLGAQTFQQPTGYHNLVTMPASGRIWLVVLSYAIVTNSSWVPLHGLTIARVEAVTSNIPLNVIQLGVAAASQYDSDSCAVSLPGLPVVSGEVIRLNVNFGQAVVNMDQQASALVLYSIP